MVFVVRDAFTYLRKPFYIFHSSFMMTGENFHCETPFVTLIFKTNSGIRPKDSNNDY